MQAVNVKRVNKFLICLGNPAFLAEWLRNALLNINFNLRKAFSYFKSFISGLRLKL
jgi:hypothetical protein